MTTGENNNRSEYEASNIRHLVPIRTTEEAREKGSKGGRVSGVKRREKASLRESLKVIMSLDCIDEKAAEVMESMGLDEDERTNAAMMNARMVMEAGRGNVRAYEALAKILPPEPSNSITTNKERTLVPPFDLSANIAPVFCDISRAIDQGTATEVILKGGRGSAKSSYAYQKCLDVFLKRPHAQWVCVRKVGNTLRRSCFANALWAIVKRGMTIGRLGADTDFSYTVSPMEITYNATGQKIVFSGLDDPEKLKSITFADPKAKVEILLWEEYAQQDGPSTVRNVGQSVFRSDYSLEFKLFNPHPDEEQWANKEAEEPLPGRIVHHSTYLDVPSEFLGKRFVEIAEQLRDINETAYQNEYMGICTGLTGRVFENVHDETITPEDIAGFKWKRNGLDWGFENDPFWFGRIAYDRKTKTLYIFGEIYNTHTLDEDNVKAVKEILAERTEGGAILKTQEGEVVFKRHKPENEVRADIAGKKDIATWNHMGVEMIGASKRIPVEDGIRWLQKRRRIVIDKDRAPLAWQEFTHYRALEDEEGRFKGYPDKDNHSIDGTRYGVFDLIADPDEI